MVAFQFLITLSLAVAADGPGAKQTPRPATEPFEAPKYGVAARIPGEWPIAVREQEDRVFVALIDQGDPDRPGVAACELGLAPESLDEYRTRIDGTARRGGRPGGTLVRNQVVKQAGGERLESLWEFHPRGGELWLEFSVRTIAHRQMYTFILNASEGTYRRVRPAFDALVASARFSPPNTGADLFARESNCWIQREYKFAIDLPEAWAPVLAPSELALLFANAPAKGVWSDNVLVLAHPRSDADLKELSARLPDQLRREEPNCEVLSCRVVPQGKTEALETVVRTHRGPFSMTVIERRFHGGRYDYEVKYTVETKRFDALLPTLRKTLDSFRELPGGPVGGAGKSA
jgi:hypothetical protein